MIKYWAKTQSNVATSSAEAEATAMLKAASEGLGLEGMMRYIGMQVNEIVLNVDASAALAMAKKEGLGRTRHIDVAILWLQQK